MESSNIDIFLRVRPVARPSSRVVLDLAEQKVAFNIPRDLDAGPINNSREHYEFVFKGLLTPEAKQDEVFERVARNVVLSSLEGYNATIFAYGQTGSGKTFTITGGAERYVDRGIIPRSISAIFAELAKRSSHQYTVHISYLELYNEVGYDLLDPGREEAQGLDKLPQVSMLEDEEGRLHCRGLSTHRVNTEEEALNLLFVGDTNRTISETPMNQASSRSHCIFTLHLEARPAGGDIVRRSKLHLVDLAGSERVGKTGIDGTTLKEAKYINLSLHFLEQVIIALQERAMGLNRSHIPYRNSMMTWLLKDSLGGNCRTAMVATISPAVEQMEESISTCRFAQRVAMVRNELAVNEEVDPHAIIRRLKLEVRDLKEELRLLRGEADDRGPLTAGELQQLQAAAAAYCSSSAADATLDVPGMGMMHVRALFSILRDSARGQPAGLPGPAAATAAAGSATAAPAAATGGGSSTTSSSSMVGSSEAQEQVKKLRLQVQQRDNEIAILVSMLKRREASGGGPVLEDVSGGQAAGGAAGAAARGGEASSSGQDSMAALLSADLLADRNKAFELFRKSYRQNEVIEENKAILRGKYDAAKALGGQVVAAKQDIAGLKARLEQRRMQRAAAGVAAGVPEADVLQQEDAEEERCRQGMEQAKLKYKAAFEQLREAKQEIERLHVVMEQSRQRLQRDFATWLAHMTGQQLPAQALQRTPAGASPGVPVARTSSSNSMGTSAAPWQALMASQQQERRMTATSSGSGGGSSGTPSPQPPLQHRQGHNSRASISSLSTHSAANSLAPTRSSSTAADTASIFSASSLASSSTGSGRPAAGAGALPQPVQQQQQLSKEPSLPLSSAGSAAAGLVAAGKSSRRSLGMMPAAAGAAGADAGALAGVPAAVMEAARPFLTGNAEADRDIIRFYEARAKLLQQMGAG